MLPGPPADVVDLANGLGRGARSAEVDEHIGARSLQPDDLRIDRGVGQLVGSLGHHAGLAFLGQRAFEALEQVLAEVIVLVEHGDLGLGQALLDVAAVEPAFGDVAGHERHGPGRALGIVEPIRAHAQQDLRHLPGVHVALDGRVGRRAQVAVDRQHFVLLDQPAHGLGGARRRVLVVIGDQLDLAPADAAALVEHGEIGLVDLAQNAVGRARPAVGHGHAEPDFAVRGADVVFLLGQRRARAQAGQCQGRGGALQRQAAGESGMCFHRALQRPITGPRGS
ncbi:hypothetical protein D3C78_1089590 [compost metagenome]